ncbi:hypothetical protein M9H77_17481 [Catharanthus roseus]|uniref:Uncharacterized protein n=1 Tax=Catharanthus roseus TaxID=4058 RepID=A0ACC0B527_CATRO|nr:hypothetical protein M9H77_17481 [Catharanthus roseus]
MSEETNLLGRSVKKTKRGLYTEFPGVIDEEMEIVHEKKPPEVPLTALGGAWGSVFSRRWYRKMMIISLCTRENIVMEEEERWRHIPLSLEERKNWSLPWKRALVLKLLGRNISLRILNQHLQDLRKLEYGFELLDMENASIMVRFYSRGDYLKVLEGGPWIVLGHYLMVSKWRPNFCPYTEEITSSMVWVRLPELLIEFFNEDLLMQAGNRLGRAVRIDDTIMAQFRDSPNLLKQDQGKTGPGSKKLVTQTKRGRTMETAHSQHSRCQQLASGQEPNLTGMTTQQPNPSGNFVKWVISADSAFPTSKYRLVTLAISQKVELFVTHLLFLGVTCCIKSPWLFLGDFNQVLRQQEKCGGKEVARNGDSLWNLIEEGDLIDIGFSGPVVTWSNFCMGDDNFMEHLDRGLCNRLWNKVFQDATLVYLPKTHSDHCLILVVTERIYIVPPTPPSLFASWPLGWIIQVLKIS